MKRVVVQIDWYTKVVLTLIAVLLAGILAKPYIATQSTYATEPLFGSDYDVTVVNRDPIPVEGYVRSYISGGEVDVSGIVDVSGEIDIDDSPPIEVEVTNIKELR